MNTSLSKFCKDANLPKSSVYSRCKELSFDTSNGLTPKMIAQLEHEFGVNVPVVKDEAIAPEVMPNDFIQSGKLATFQERDIQLPQGFDVSAMVQFFDGVTGEATDTTSLVAIADMALNAVESALDNKVAQQRQKLSQAEQDAKALADKIATAQTNLKIKALESRMLAERQTAATKDAEAAFANLMALGKPADPDATDPA